MSGVVASGGSREPPASGRAADTAGFDDVKLGAVLTLVLWLGCVTVGVLGLILPYQRPRPLVIVPSPVQAELVDVEMASIPLPAPEPVPSLPTSRIPAPAPAPMVIPEGTPLMAVAAPSPAIVFALPVEGTTRLVAPAQAAYVRPPTPAAAPPTPLPAESLTFGQGEGRQPAPDYPRSAVREGQEGTVRVGLTVGEDGRVLAAEVVTASPWPLLNEAALRTVRQRWRFAPGTLRRYEVPIRFQLQK